jgi:hypothetical protein
LHGFPEHNAVEDIPMFGETPTLKGIVRGKTIELEHANGLPDGQAVSVVVRATPPAKGGNGLRRAFGAWADDLEGLDEVPRPDAPRP